MGVELTLLKLPFVETHLPCSLSFWVVVKDLRNYNNYFSTVGYLSIYTYIVG
jgi:hypothetical protein